MQQLPQTKSTQAAIAFEYLRSRRTWLELKRISEAADWLTPLADRSWGNNGRRCSSQMHIGRSPLSTNWQRLCWAIGSSRLLASGWPNCGSTSRRRHCRGSYMRWIKYNLAQCRNRVEWDSKGKMVNQMCHKQWLHHKHQDSRGQWVPLRHRVRHLVNILENLNLEPSHKVGMCRFCLQDP